MVTAVLENGCRVEELLLSLSLFFFLKISDIVLLKHASQTLASFSTYPCLLVQEATGGMGAELHSCG